jgi:hypothetical protein
VGAILPNPVLDAWRSRAELQLANRRGRNIAGVKRASAPAAAGNGALPMAPTTAVLKPTSYHKVLLERCKQLVALAPDRGRRLAAL